MNPLCEKCRGACCETWAIAPVNYESPHELHELVEGRTAGEADGYVFLNCRCRHLTVEGRCGIYQQRPTLCRTFEPLGEGCLRTLEAVRPELFKEVQSGAHGSYHGQAQS